MPRSKLSTGICLGPTAMVFSTLKATIESWSPIPTGANSIKRGFSVWANSSTTLLTKGWRRLPKQLAWDDDLVRNWLPLDAWLRDFHLEETSQYLQATNWLDRYTHLRRLTLIPIVVEPFDDRNVFPDSQYGLVCPYCTPEGPNIGRVLEVARGARVRDGKLERIDEAPDSILGFSASMLPFLEHDDSNRALMGVNMMRQWTSAADTAAPVHSTGWFRQQHDQRLASKGHKPEPALVQTGYEPEAADFWGGYNLLTAFVMWDGDTFEDGLVISESAAARMNFPAAVGVGDKLSNRHGSKGVVTRILPDADMPQLPDGAPIELIFSPTSMVSRLNFGQQREAVMGRLAQAEGTPAVVPPFQAPSEKVLKERLVEAGLPEDGMDQLTLKGEALPYRSTVGWVYWGRLAAHTAARALGNRGGRSWRPRARHDGLRRFVRGWGRSQYPRFVQHGRG